MFALSQNMHPSKKMWSMDDSTKPDARGFTGWGARDDSSNSWGSAPPGMSREYFVCLCLYVGVCVCVCLYERHREREECSE